MLDTPDAFDPRTWVEVPWKPLWLDPAENLFAMVDPVDHAWAVRYTWSVMWDRHGRKAYAVRYTSVLGARRQTLKLWLHKEIVVRAYGERPTKHHVLGDHRDGDSLNCVRSNLRWSTRSQNRLNINGSHRDVDFLTE